MSGSESRASVATNSIHRVAAGGGLLLGIFLMLGGVGHLQAVGPTLGTADENTFALLLPALILMATGIIDIGVSRALWLGSVWSLNVALVCNALTTLYLGYLLAAGVPGHPIGLFLSLLASFVLLLGAVRVGLVWPAPAEAASNG